MSCSESGDDFALTQEIMRSGGRRAGAPPFRVLCGGWDPKRLGKAGTGRFESGACPATSSSQLLERDHSEQSIQPIVRSCRKVKLILLPVVRSPTTELDRPKLVDGNRLALGVLERTHKRAGRKIESIDRARVRV